MKTTNTLPCLSVGNGSRSSPFTIDVHGLIGKFELECRYGVAYFVYRRTLPPMTSLAIVYRLENYRSSCSNRFRKWHFYESNNSKDLQQGFYGDHHNFAILTSFLQMSTHAEHNVGLLT